MIKKIVETIFGSPNERELKELWPIVDRVNEEFRKLEDLSDEELQGKTDEFKARIDEEVAAIEDRQEEIRERLHSSGRQVPVGGDGHVGGNGQMMQEAELSLEERQALHDELDALEEEWQERVDETLDELLPEAFAVVKETCRRMLGETWQAGGAKVEWEMVPYDVQVLGGIVLHRGRIAEMKTGEGKTLAAVMPVYLNALAGRGVHLVTVNPYLAERDTEWMGPIYEFLGLTVDCVDRYEPHSEGRRRAYQADITYGTNNEFGFDYLRDNSFVSDPSQLVQRGHHYAIIDEIDSVLIDEARTPLIISGPVPESNEDKYKELKPYVEKIVYAQKRLVAQLVRKAEDLLDEKAEAEAEGDSDRASELEDEAGLALLRAQRGYPRNKQLVKLKSEKPGAERLLQQTEYFYLQDNAKRMPFVDEELYFALDEKKKSVEITDKGQKFIADAAGEDEEFFVIPDLGDELATLEEEYEQDVEERKAELQNDESLSEEKRSNKLQNDLRIMRNRFEEKKRELYNLYSVRSERIHAVNQLLKAYTLFERDVEYIVQEGKVEIVDEHTGRVLKGRRYSDGLHQALEAKEDVQVEAATQTYASVTLQNYFRMYEKLAGMTGTAETEAHEFDEIYDLQVNVIPTHEPVIRDDKEDLIFRSRREKYKAVIDQIEKYNEKGQPVLVGTTSVEVSETLSRMLQREGIDHNVLNARQDRRKQEAMIIAEAGQQGAVTIATNMAGRGTDIKLGPGVRERGGLAIIGTERHESRRIDLQLRGRAGRQGDPGESQFYLSLEDDLMRLFGSERTAKIMDRLGLEEGEVITHSWITKSIRRAQSKVEQNNFSIRKRQLEYDDVLNNQRKVIYSRRRHALEGERLHGDILNMLYDLIDYIVDRHYGEGGFDDMREDLLRMLAFDYDMPDRDTAVSWGQEELVERIYEAAAEHYSRKRELIARPLHEAVQRLIDSDLDEKPEHLYVDFTDGNRVLRAKVSVEEAQQSEGQIVNDTLERVAMLSIIDEVWTDHLRELDELKEGIGLRSFGRKDPVVEYKRDAFELFREMMNEMEEQVVSLVFKAGPVVEGEEGGEPVVRAKSVGGPRPKLDRDRAKTEHEAHDSYGVDYEGDDGQGSGAQRDPSSKQEPVVAGEKVGRNDPCPCGSGKKYKHCCGVAG
jgi:preprotein translocase subunit SecA